jgi:hypothetical protein
MIASNLVRSLGLGHFPSLINYGGLHGGQSTRSITLSLSSIGYSPINSEILRGFSNSSNMSHWGSLSSGNTSVLHGLFNAMDPRPLSLPAPPSLTDTDPVPSLVASQSHPIPFPVDWFTLPSINSFDDYLAAWDHIPYWLRCPGFSTAHSDAALITDPSNALASQFWGDQIRTALKDGPASFLSENSSTYFDKSFEMLQVLKDNFHPSSISNMFTTLLSLFNDRQSNTEGIHEFSSRFKGNLSALSHSLVAIP